MKDYWFFRLRFSTTLALSAAVLLILSALVVGADAQQRDAVAYLSPQLRSVVEKWLAGKPGLRLATEADCVNESGLAAIRKEDDKNYQPYYAVGDFNGDGKQDLAVALINKRLRKDNFAIAIFHGPLKANSAPAFIGSWFDLSTGGLSVDASSKRNRLKAGVFDSDDCWVLQWRGKSYSAKYCLDE